MWRQPSPKITLSAFVSMTYDVIRVHVQGSDIFLTDGNRNKKEVHLSGRNIL